MRERERGGGGGAFPRCKDSRSRTFIRRGLTLSKTRAVGIHAVRFRAGASNIRTIEHLTSSLTTLCWK